MALAARCPHCRALFRVIADQLKLRGGLVRCGECRRVFDAIGSLSYVDDHVLAKEEAEAPVAGAAAPGPPVPVPAAAHPIRPREAVAPVPLAASPARVARPAQAAGRSSATAATELRDELAVPTLFGMAEPMAEAATEESGPAEDTARSPAAAPVESRAVPAGLRNRDAAPADREAAGATVDTEDAGLEAASFLPGEEQPRERRLRRALGIACAPLAILAAVQLGLALRNDALESWPSLHPLVARACWLFGCTAGWPQHAEMLTVIGSELAAIPETDAIELNAAIRSRAGFTMALPALEVTLTDTQNRILARKIFLPGDYLASSGELSSRLDQGLAPGSDLSVRLVFEAGGLKPSGFEIYLFYL